MHYLSSFFKCWNSRYFYIIALKTRYVYLTDTIKVALKDYICILTDTIKVALKDYICILTDTIKVAVNTPSKGVIASPRRGCGNLFQNGWQSVRNQHARRELPPSGAPDVSHPHYR